MQALCTMILTVALVVVTMPAANADIFEGTQVDDVLVGTRADDLMYRFHAATTGSGRGVVATW